MIFSGMRYNENLRELTQLSEIAYVFSVFTSFLSLAAICTCRLARFHPDRILA